jgi:hypothetical protein
MTFEMTQKATGKPIAKITTLERSVKSVPAYAVMSAMKEPEG